ncbi:glycoside hydrolase family 16 protein [Crucibulum laeve]|uniref:Glycoside hydrolase family 16 protein n=1 Tax=Crucibulum laeve TaxID=68775 RepID=A0A5C3MHP5_9AGAR|nr:glycoside hydrolase family 16 protein [Crucibulum laeve]
MSSTPILKKKPTTTDFGQWVDLIGSHETSPYPLHMRSSLSRLSSHFSSADDPHQWRFSLALDTADSSDDELHDPKGILPRKIDRQPVKNASRKGLANFGCLVLLCLALLTLFIGYPIITFVGHKPISNFGAFNTGGLNATGQVPAMTGNFGLVDNDTPKEAYTRLSWADPSAELQLVFSDEFNTDGRSFYPGDDPYWEAVDLHYWATNNLEWYDPEAVTTQDGSLVITLSQKETHDLHYEGGLISTWNKFCFTGGYIETSVSLPGANNILGLWPAIWTMGNLGRAGYGASLEGVWPYTYDSCDVGTLANQTLQGLPLAATMNGDEGNGGVLSYLPGQRLSRCTCSRESHPGPKHPDGTFVGRSAPEIDVFEAQINEDTLVAQVSQSAQWAPFNEAYMWANTSDNMIISDPTISHLNSFTGSVTQQATSVVTNTDGRCYEDAAGCFSVYGFEYKPGFDEGYITWISNNVVAWTVKAAGLGADPVVQISERPVPQEPMYLIANLGMSRNFGPVDLLHLPFPVHMRVDYIRVYQPKNAINIGCNPKDFPTEDYINKYIDAYTNPNLTTWVNDYHQEWPKNSFLGQC